MASRCVCPTVDCGDGEPRVEWPDPDCPLHGRGDEWRVGDPLRKYALVSDANDYYRILESPRQTEARLVAERRS